MRLSVIIPAYNCERDIQRCIDSVFNQTEQEFEIIVVNDGSTDGTQNVLEMLGKQHANIRIHNKKNGGVASARNAGLQIAKGDYVTFIDADDYLIDVDYFQKLLVSNADYVTAGYTERDQEGNERYNNRKNCQGTGLIALPNEFFVNGWFHTCWAKLYRREILLSNGICFQPLRISEDSLFNLEYLNHAITWKIIDNCGYCYIKNRKGLNALSKYDPLDIDSYLILQERLKSLGLKSRIVRKTMYAQFLALLLRVTNNAQLSKKEKKQEQRRLLLKKGVLGTLILTMNNPGEWFLCLRTVMNSLL